MVRTVTVLLGMVLPIVIEVVGELPEEVDSGQHDLLGPGCFVAADGFNRVVVVHVVQVGGGVFV